MRGTLRDCGALLALLAVVALAGGDPHVDLPVAHPLDPRPVSELPPAVARALEVMPLPPPADDPPGDDPKDEPPPVFYGEEIESVDETIVYVLDRSASMGGSRWESAQRESCRSIQGLPPSFSFDVVLYSCEMLVLWPDGLRVASQANKDEACAWIRERQPQGGTGTGPAVCAALALGAMSVVLLTDGEPTCPGYYTELVGTYKQALVTTNAVMQGHRAMIRNANQGATINVFGVEARNECRRFAQGVASDNGGSYYDVP